jgi:uncharacterized protein DUF4328
MSPSEDLSDALDDVRARAFWAQCLLGAVVVTNLLGLWTLVGQSALLADAANGLSVSAGRAAESDGWVEFFNKVHLGVYVVCAIVYLVWFYGAYALLERVGTGHTESSPRWATFEWFIPFLNLVRPYKNIVEMWHRSAGRNERNAAMDPEGPGLVALWWGAYLIANFSSRFITSFDRVGENSIDGLSTSTYMWMGFNLLQGASGVLAILVIRKIHGFQEQFVVPEMVPATGASEAALGVTP